MHRRILCTVSAMLAVAAGTANGAITLAWAQVPIPANSHTVGNSTINGKLPPGVWDCWELRATFSEGDRTASVSLRATLPGNAGFFRHTLPNPEKKGDVIDLSFLRLSSATADNPSRGASAGVSFPLNPDNVFLLGSLSADGFDRPVDQAVLPSGLDGTSFNDGLISAIWTLSGGGVPVPPTGTYSLVRLTAPGRFFIPASAADNIIGLNSKVTRISNGSPASPVPVPPLGFVPEPGSLGVVTVVSMIASNRRTKRWRLLNNGRL